MDAADGGASAFYGLVVFTVGITVCLPLTLARAGKRGRTWWLEEARLGTSPFGTSGGGYRTRIGPDRVRPGTTAPGGAMGTPLTSRPPSGAPMGGGSLR